MSQKYSRIALEYLQTLDKLEPEVSHKIISYGNLQLMETLFDLFGGNREEIYKRTGCIGHQQRFAYVMNRLDRESKEQGALFQKGYISYSGIINRPTRCFSIKDYTKHFSEIRRD